MQLAMRRFTGFVAGALVMAWIMSVHLLLAVAVALALVLWERGADPAAARRLLRVTAGVLAFVLLGVWSSGFAT